MKIQVMKPSDLIEYDNNPRNNDDAVDAVANSINEFGFKVPIIITKDNIIVAGHTRLKAALKLGLTEVPCLIADDLNEEQIKAFRLADNKTAELATWDLKKLEEELFDIDMDMLQFGLEELESQIPDNATDDDFDPTDEIPKIPVSQKGDLYVLGNHRVMGGDSTIKENVEQLLDGNIVDMIFTDPPYNVDYEGTVGKIRNDKMEDSSFYLFLFNAFTNMFENTKKGGAIYVCHVDTEGLNFRNAFKNVGFKLAECLIRGNSPQDYLNHSAYERFVWDKDSSVGFINWLIKWKNKQGIELTSLYESSEIGDAWGTLIPNAIKNDSYVFIDTVAPNFTVISTEKTIYVGLYTDIDWTNYMYNLSDNNYGNVTKYEIYDNVTYYLPGKYYVLLAARDDSGNEKTVLFTVRVIFPGCLL